MKAHYTAQQKTEVLADLAAGLSLREISESRGVKPQTISNWKAEHKRMNGGADPKKKRSKRTRGPEESTEEKIRKYSLWTHLEQLKTNALRRMLSERDQTKWPLIENEYLRERCRAFGDPSVGPLLEAPVEATHE